MKWIAMVPINIDEGRFPLGAELPVKRLGLEKLKRLSETIAYGKTPMVVAVPDDAVVQIVGGSVRLQDLHERPRGVTTAHGPKVVITENKMAASDTEKASTEAPKAEVASTAEEAPSPKKPKG